MKFVLIIFMIIISQCSTITKYNNKQNEPKIIKKIISGEERWFEEIQQIYEEIVYEYDDYADELSLGHKMDLGKLINDYDISEDCFEEDISTYEYYDSIQQINDQNYEELINEIDQIQSVIVKKEKQDKKQEQKIENIQENKQEKQIKQKKKTKQ